MSWEWMVFGLIATVSVVAGVMILGRDLKYWLRNRKRKTSDES